MQIMTIVSDTSEVGTMQNGFIYIQDIPKTERTLALYLISPIPYVESGSKLSLINTCKKFREFRGKTLCIMICCIIQR